ncbi:hypothetical protein F2Q68_00046762 [Brassica cretica]|uniref:Uncharacterized protein n=1 Tax=Brassica cretica TaxID=69181 RepID=A0A8S9MEH2_BRACR|nr:hypothetical protein F2Q68_00046762 [Brassica cretica]
MKSSEVVKVSSEGESSRKSPDSEGLKVNNEATVAKEVLGDKIYSNSKGSGCEGNVWSLPARASRSPPVSAIKNGGVEISASKFSVLSVDEVEEGELVVEGESNMREVVIENEDADEVDVVDCDLRNDTVDQQVQEEIKVGLQRGSGFLPPGLGPCLQPPAFRPSDLSCFRINENLP